MAEHVDDTLHLRDWRCGKPWCVHPHEDVKPGTHYARQLSGSDCPMCIALVERYRDMTAKAATGGLSISPDYARKRWRMGMDSAALRRVVLRAMARDGIAP